MEAEESRAGPVIGDDLLGDLREALVGFALVSKAPPAVDDRDFVLPPPPGPDEPGSCWEGNPSARPRLSLLAPRRPRRRLSSRAPNRRPQPSPGLGIDSALGLGLDPPCEFPEEYPLWEGWSPQFAALSPDLSEFVDSQGFQKLSSRLLLQRSSLLAP